VANNPVIPTLIKDVALEYTSNAQVDTVNDYIGIGSAANSGKTAKTSIDVLIQAINNSTTQRAYLTDATLFAADLIPVLTNYQAPGSVTLTLPQATVGAFFDGARLTDNVFRFKPYGAESFLGGDPGGYLEILDFGVVQGFCFVAGQWTIYAESHANIWRLENGYQGVSRALGLYRVKDFGADKTGNTDSTAAIQACRTAAFASATPATILFDPGEYLVTNSSLVELFDDMTVSGYGATIVVGASGNTYRNAALSGGYYQNGLFYKESGVVSNFTMRGLSFSIADVKIGPLQIGNTGVIDGAVVGSNISVQDCVQNGGASWTMVAAKNVVFSRNRAADTDQGMLFFNDENATVEENNFEYVGVNRAETAWQNVAGFVGNNNNGLTLSKNRFNATGGTAVLIRASAKPCLDINVTGNIIRKAGYSAVVVEVASFATNNSYLRNVNITDNQVSGFLCGVLSGTGAGDHDAITVATEKTGYPANGVVIARNVINFLSPTETWDGTDLDVAGSANPKKTRYNDIGTCSGIQVTGEDTSTPITDLSITGNVILHSPCVGIRAVYANNCDISGNVLRRNGYQRQDPAGANDNQPYTSAHGIYVFNSALVGIGDNRVYEHNPGCDGQNSANTYLVRAEDSFAVTVSDNTLHSNDTVTAANSWNNTIIGFSGSGFTMTGFTSRTCSITIDNNDCFGSYFGLSGADGMFNRHISGTGTMRVSSDAYIESPTGTPHTVQKGVITVMAARTSTTQTITLPDPSLLTGTRITVKHRGLGTGLVTIATAAGTLWPAAPTLANTGEFKTFLANGTVWEQV
jgi:hypothetical protein